MTDRFGNMQHTVTMTGEEWFALMARLAGRGLSLKGARAYKRAADKLAAQLTAHSKNCKQEEASK